MMASALFTLLLVFTPAAEGEAPPPAREDAPAPLDDAPVPDDEEPPEQEAREEPFKPDLAAAEGLAPWLMTPLQAAVGAGVAIPLVVIFPIAPFVVAFVVASTGDLLGTKRGPVLWPMVGGYLGMIAGGLVPTLGWFVAFALGGALSAVGLLLGGAVMTMGLPVVITAIGVGILYVTGITTFVVPVAAAVAAGIGEGCGAAGGYALTAEDKEPGDVEFRFPGFIRPSHGPDRYLVAAPGSPPAAMAY